MITALITRLFQLPRAQKRLIQIAFDAGAIALAFWLAMVLRLEGVGTGITLESWSVLIAVVPVTILVFIRLGLYRAVIRFMAERALRAVAVGVLASATTMLIVSQALGLFVPRSVPGIYLTVLMVLVGGSRVGMRSLYLSAKEQGREPVLIYGAGEIGRQLLVAIDQSRNFRAGFFLDDSKQLHGTDIGGVMVTGPEAGRDAARRLGIKTALLAIPDAQAEGRRRAAKLLSGWGLEVRVIPNIADLITGRVRISELRRVSVEEVLGREPVPPIPDLLSATVTGRSVMVTGAGGSIGSELCRQILAQAPRRLVLLDASEFALYRIHEDLKERREAAEAGYEIVPVLGSITRRDVMVRAMRDYAVETVFHAAAYKHVPLVEANAVEGVRNNLLGTEAVASAAGECGVRNFTLISTDKAVRPTNVMGATKRAAELVVQAAAAAHPGTRYCSVRFGNVLGSSGSVIPKFERQIAAGGPITLTHPEVTRYFMTIPEAAQLVIQASAMAECGEVYLLDMGQPIKIIDLARTMARLHGRDAYIEGVDTPLPTGIAVRVTGLRPGEKLNEELLVNGGSHPTAHPSVRQDDGSAADPATVIEWLGRVRQLCVEENASALITALAGIGLEYAPADHSEFR